MWVATKDNHNRLEDGLVSIHATHVGGDSSFQGSSSCYRCFYPRHPCGWRQFRKHQQRKTIAVSIHATHVGGDFRGKHLDMVKIPVSIHATHVGGDAYFIFPRQPFIQFLSTPPMWVATVHSIGETVQRKVSIHATHVGGDSSVPLQAG